MVLSFPVGSFGDIKCHLARVAWVSWGHPWVDGITFYISAAPAEAHWPLEMVKYRKPGLLHASGDILIFNRRFHMAFCSQKNTFYAYFPLEGPYAKRKAQSLGPQEVVGKDRGRG